MSLAVKTTLQKNASTAARAQPVSMLDRLRQKPERFSPFQALRLIEAWLPFSRFSASARRSHTGTPIGVEEDDRGQSAFPVDLVGLIGVQGSLPAPYLDQAIVERKRKNRAFGAFLDIFNDRLIRLFVRGAEKHHLAGQLSRASLECRYSGSKSQGTIADFIYALCGFGTPQLRNRLSLPDDLVIYYAGLLTQRPACMSNLRSIVEDYLGLPVRIMPFQPQWLTLPADQQTRLTGNTPLGKLGVTAVSGASVREHVSHFRICIGPCGQQDFNSFATGSLRRKQLADLVTLYVGLDKSFDVQIILKREDIPDCRMGGTQPTVLGWNGWMAHMPLLADPSDAIISHRQLTAHLAPQSFSAHPLWEGHTA